MNISLDEASQELRRTKEFVYEQWRKILCIFVVGEDISHNKHQPQNVTSEQIRTVFNNGYKMALLQTKESLSEKLNNNNGREFNKLVEDLINEVEDRLETSKCFTSYAMSVDKDLLSSAIQREKNFSKHYTEKLSTWGQSKM